MGKIASEKKSTNKSATSNESIQTNPLYLTKRITVIFLNNLVMSAA